MSSSAKESRKSDLDHFDTPKEKAGSAKIPQKTPKEKEIFQGEKDEVDPIEKNVFATPVKLRFQSSYGKEYKARLFQHNLIGENYTVVFYAKRRVGKTYALKAIMQARRHLFPRVVVFTRTKEDREYNSLVPRNAIVKGLNVNILHALMELQSSLVEDLHERGVNDRNIKLLIVIDDCLGDGLRYKTELDRLFYNGRHLQIEVYVTSQDMKGLPPALVENTDLAITGAMRQQRSKEALREKFADFFHNDDEFDEVMNNILNRGKFMLAMFHVGLPWIPPEELMFCGRFQQQEEKNWPIVMGDRDFWGGSESELMKHPNGHVLLSPPHSLLLVLLLACAAKSSSNFALVYLR